MNALNEGAAPPRAAGEVATPGLIRGSRSGQRRPCSLRRRKMPAIRPMSRCAARRASCSRSSVACQFELAPRREPVIELDASTDALAPTAVIAESVAGIPISTSKQPFNRLGSRGARNCVWSQASDARLISFAATFQFGGGLSISSLRFPAESDCCPNAKMVQASHRVTFVARVSFPRCAISADALAQAAHIMRGYQDREG